MLFFQSLDEKDVKAAAKTAEKADEKKKNDDDKDESGLEKCLAKKKLEVDICRADTIVNSSGEMWEFVLQLSFYSYLYTCRGLRSARLKVKKNIEKFVKGKSFLKLILFSPP